MHVPPVPLQARSAFTGRLTKVPNAPPKPSLSVVFAGVVKSTWNFMSLRFPVAALECRTKILGAPAGGGVTPSQSEGRKPKDPPAKTPRKHCAVAAPLISISDRS